MSDQTSKTESVEMTSIHEALQVASSVWTEASDNALNLVMDSQDALKDQLDALEKDMQSTAEALAATGSISGQIVRSITEAHECLQRARRKLIVVRARVGRLRTFEEAHRLSNNTRS